MIKSGITLEENQISDYEKHMLTCGAIKDIFPVNIVEGEYNDVMLFFDTNGFIPISYVNELEIPSMLKLIKKILRLIENLKDYLLEPEEYEISPETIYVKKDLSDVKMIYSKTANTESGIDRIISLFNKIEIKKKDEILKRISLAFNEERKKYIDQISFIDEMISEYRLIN